MLRVRPYRKDDAKTIVTWCKDEETFYKWTARIMGEYPLTIQRLEEATSGRIDNDRYFPFVAVDDEHVVGFRETGEEEWYEMSDRKWKCLEMEIKSIYCNDLK